MANTQALGRTAIDSPAWFAVLRKPRSVSLGVSKVRGAECGIAISRPAESRGERQGSAPTIRPPPSVRRCAAQRAGSRRHHLGHITSGIGVGSPGPHHNDGAPYVRRSFREAHVVTDHLRAVRRQVRPSRAAGGRQLRVPRRRPRRPGAARLLRLGGALGRAHLRHRHRLLRGDRAAARAHDHPRPEGRARRARHRRRRRSRT